ncbi:hypothetical protein [Paracoccus sediminilitoris]|uniref:hypothetical protein n=1 Tax=Paracoccus sediminilitoris TaxID=2202419 RepID=UPI0018F4D43A|nr:hypothetical protein [Paracoccus sediminilitoris]
MVIMMKAPVSQSVTPVVSDEGQFAAAEGSVTPHPIFFWNASVQFGGWLQGLSRMPGIAFH